MSNFAFGKPAAPAISFGTTAAPAAQTAPAASVPAPTFGGITATTAPATTGAFGFGAKPAVPAAGGFASIAPSTTAAKPAFGGFGGMAGTTAGKPSADLSEDQKAMKLSDVVQHLTLDLEQNLSSYTEAVQDVQNSDKEVYGTLFQLQQLFTGMAAVSDQINEDYDILARISLEQVQLYEELQKTASGLPGNQQIMDAALRLQEVQTRLISATVGDVDLLQQIQAQQDVLDEVSKAVGLKKQ